MSEKILWKDVKKNQNAWNHIQVSLSGNDDTCICAVCKTEVSLIAKGRKRESILLETARKHFYKHKLNLTGEGGGKKLRKFFSLIFRVLVFKVLLQAKARYPQSFENIFFPKKMRLRRTANISPVFDKKAFRLTLDGLKNSVAKPARRNETGKTAKPLSSGFCV